MTSLTYEATKGVKTVGGEQGLWLADTTAESLVGSEIKLNSSASHDGDFTQGDGALASPYDEWTSSASTLTIESNQLKILNTGASAGAAVSYLIPVVAGKTYLISATCDGTNADNSGIAWGIEIDGGSQWGITGQRTVTIDGAFNYTYTADTTRNIGLRYRSRDNTINSYVLLDDVSVRIAVPDITTNDKGLGVHGTITKAAVNTGSELMAYSGFSASNYLEQPYNADLDFGTGDFCFMIWFKSTDVASNMMLMDRSDVGYTGTRIDLLKLPTGAIRFLLHDGTDSVTTTTDGSYANGDWHFISGLNRGNASEIYVDGVFVKTAVTTTIDTMNNTSAILRIGLDTAGANPLSTGDVTLSRALSYAPTAAEIKTIYDSEKILFLKNRVYTQVGEDYSIYFGPERLTRSANAVRTVQRSIGGQQSTLNFRDEGFWDLTTAKVDMDDFDATRRALDSVTNGQTFEIDPFGALAAVDDPISVTLESNGYTETRSGVRLLNASFKVRET